MEVVKEELLCSKCGAQHHDPTFVSLRITRVEKWPRSSCHDEYVDLRRTLKCPICGAQVEVVLPRGRAPTSYLPGTRATRVFVGGNYKHLFLLRQVRDAIHKVAPGFHSILPYDDYDIPDAEIYDTDLLLLHNCKYAIFEVSLPAGELFEIARCGECKVQALLVYQPERGEELPPQVRTMLLQSGMHELQTYKYEAEELEEIVRRFLLAKDPQGWAWAAEAAGYFLTEYTARHVIESDGHATHNYRITARVGIPGFQLRQIPHKFMVTSGTVEEFTVTTDPDTPPVTWKPAVAGSKGGDGLIEFETPLTQADGTRSYEVTVRTRDAFAMTASRLEQLVEQGATSPVLIQGFENVGREIVIPTELLTIEVQFPEGYSVSAQPLAHFGGELREDGLRETVDTFVYENGRARLVVSKPRMRYRYCIAWRPPEEWSA